MKRFLLTTLVSLNLVLLPSCRTVPPETQVYKTVGVTVNSVQTGLRVWNEYVGTGKATIEQERAVEKAYITYQKSMSLLEVLITSNRNDTNEMDSTVGMVMNSRKELLELITNLTKKH